LNSRRGATTRGRASRNIGTHLSLVKQKSPRYAALFTGRNVRAGRASLVISRLCVSRSRSERQRQTGSAERQLYHGFGKLPRRGREKKGEKILGELRFADEADRECACETRRGQGELESGEGKKRKEITSRHDALLRQIAPF